MKNAFVFSDKPEPHRLRTKEILKQHPQIRNLIGKNPVSFVAIVGLVALMVVLAWVSASQPWWVIFLLAYFVGAFADHGLFVLIHECAHRLLFKNPAANRQAGILANMPQIFPSSVSFERYHIKHHSFQGIHELDADLPNHWEAKLINNYFIGKTLWLLLFPFFQIFRISRLKEIKPFDKWIALNWLAQIAFTAIICYWLGWKGFGFLFMSFFFSIGLHPLGARWIQEHYLVLSKEQETYSYYGVLNTVAFNVGYHNEHHDFPSVPWNRLPKIKSGAPSFYNNLLYHKSWTGLFFRFLFDQEISLFSRVIRNNRGKVKLVDESKPDVEILAAESDRK